MRIALVPGQIAPIREPQIGGAQVLVVDVARALSDRGHDVTVFAPSGSHIDGVQLVDTGIDPEQLGSTVVDGAVAVPAPLATEVFRHVFDLVGRDQWDCVHNHAFDAPAITAATALPGRVVHTLHLPPDRTVADAIGGAAWTRPVIVAVSAAAAREWERIVHVDAVIRNGVPVARIPWTATATGDLLFVGRLSPEKGADIAIDIASRTGRRLTVIGGAYDREWAERLVANAPAAVVDFLAPMSREDAWTHMGRASALLAPSRWEEPFGLSIAEAQASGTPVIATARGALPEIVRDGVTGWIVDGLDGAVEAVGRVPLIDRRECRRHAERELDMGPMLDAYERLYAGCRESRTRPSGET